MDKTGRPSYSDEHYERWLYDLAPHLMLGLSLDRAIEKANLRRQRTTLYEKYRLKDWFSYKVDGFQRFLGEMVNEIYARLIFSIHKKVERGEELTSRELRTLKFFVTTHRSTIPFFVHKNEVLHIHTDQSGKFLQMSSNLVTGEKEQLGLPKNQIDPLPELEAPLQALLDTLQ